MLEGCSRHTIRILVPLKCSYKDVKRLQTMTIFVTFRNAVCSICPGLQRWESRQSLNFSPRNIFFLSSTTYINLFCTTECNTRNWKVAPLSLAGLPLSVAIQNRWKHFCLVCMKHTKPFGSSSLIHTLPLENHIRWGQNKFKSSLKKFCRITDADEIKCSTDTQKSSYLTNNRRIEPLQGCVRDTTHCLQWNNQKVIVSSSKGQTKVKQHCTDTEHSLDSAPINNTLV